MHSSVSKGAVLLLAVALPDNFKPQRDLWFIGPALKLYIFMPPFVRHCAAHAHVLDVHVTLYIKNTARGVQGGNQM